MYNVATPQQWQYGKVTIDFDAVNGEDGAQILIEQASVEVVSDSSGWGGVRTEFVLTPAGDGKYKYRTVPGAITKGAQALLELSNKDKTVFVDNLAHVSRERQDKLRSQAKAVLEAAGAL